MVVPVVLVALVVLAVVALFQCRHSDWPYCFSRSQIDRLANPVAVRGWDERGLLLASGRLLPLPEVKRLRSRGCACDVGSHATKLAGGIGLLLALALARGPRRRRREHGE